MELNELSKYIHQDNVKRGFWDEKREIGTLLMLCTSELAEALEADRNGRHANVKSFVSDCSDVGFKESFLKNIKDTFEDEIADTVIRLLDLCGGLNIDINWHVEKKIYYNRERGHKHGKLY